jgi:hypothetical protein
MIIILLLKVWMTGLTLRKLAVIIPLFHRLSVPVKFMSVMTTQTIKVHLIQMQVRICSGRNAKKGMTTPGNMACYTYIQHVRGFVETVSVG